MKKRKIVGIVFLFILLVTFNSVFVTGFTSQAGDYSESNVFKTSARVSENPARITIELSEGRGGDNIIIYRRNFEEISWGASLTAGWGNPIATLPSTTQEWTDTNVIIGQAYEYQIYQQRGAPAGIGYLLSGIKIPVKEYRGKIILLVKDNIAVSLSYELNRLKLDLIGDGWQVIKYDILESKTVKEIKAIIKQEYDKDPDNVKAVFIIGHIAVPYSGYAAWDGHDKHLGAWPADLYYGDIDGAWLDTINFGGSGRQSNYAGDGKFDASVFPSDIDLMVGRVDLSYMPAFGINEIELTRRYLNKDHDFRTKKTIVSRRALISDNLPTYTHPFAASGLRIASIVGVRNVYGGYWSSLISNDYLWANGVAGGDYYGWVNGMGTTYTYAVNTYKAIFNIMTGSYFGDWDTINNFLRAPLANPTYGLTNAWIGFTPPIMFHHMGLGEVIGYGFLFPGQTPVSFALMGDPTLRLEYVSPASNLVGVKNKNSVDLSWNSSTDNVVGYYVYRALTIDGNYTRITPNLINSTSYTDLSTLTGREYYMVRAVALTVSASGSYYNPSQGIFFNLSGANQTCNENQICESGENITTCPEDCECEKNADCFDTNICTAESCVDKRCVYVNNQNTCNDNNPCTINDKCSQGTCLGTQKNCDDNDDCTIDLCANGFCQYIFNQSSICSCHSDLDCSDNNYCTNDLCINHKCVSKYNNLSCNDNNPCTINDTCSQDICMGTAKNCDDGISCTLDSCINGNCVSSTLYCSCNNDSDCKDNNLCTDNFCEETTRTCARNFNSLSCDDNNAGTVNDKCYEGLCVGEEICNMNNICEQGESCSNCPTDCYCKGREIINVLDTNISKTEKRILGASNAPVIAKTYTANFWLALILGVIVLVIISFLIFPIVKSLYNAQKDKSIEKFNLRRKLD